MAKKLALVAAAAAMAMAAVSAQAARVNFSSLDPETQAKACEAMRAEGATGTYVYVVSKAEESAFDDKMVGTLLTEVFTGATDFTTTRVSPANC